MKEIIKQKLEETEGRIKASENQIQMLSGMLDEAYTVHNCLIGERDGYIKLLQLAEEKKGDTENAD